VMVVTACQIILWRSSRISTVCF